MPFQKGQSGNPGGRGKAKPISDMYRRIMADQRRLKRYCMSVYRAAIKGDTTAAKEIADRLEGKPLQTVDVNDNRLNSAERLAELLASAVSADSPEVKSGRPN
jgi:hypothetical protein